MRNGDKTTSKVVGNDDVECERVVKANLEICSRCGLLDSRSPGGRKLVGGVPSGIVEFIMTLGQVLRDPVD